MIKKTLNCLLGAAAFNITTLFITTFSIMINATPGPNVIKLFTAVIYSHSMVILSFCVIKQHYLGNYCRMAVITAVLV